MTDVQQPAKMRIEFPRTGSSSLLAADPTVTGPDTAVRPVDVPAFRAAPRPPRVDSKDPRYLALRNFAISMSVFNVIGYTILGFEQPWTWPLFALLVGYTAEITIEVVAAWATRRRAEFMGNGAWGLYTFLLPTHITALACNMLLYANNRFWPIAFGIVAAIGAKTVLRAPINGRMRHYMNPSNFGITIVLLCFPWVNIAPPYHFTENVPDVFRVMIPMIIATAGTVMNSVLTKKVFLIMGWAGGFVIQALIRHWIWGVALWGALGPMSGVAFILFTNYMITDPGTSPSKPKWMFMFGASVATVYGVLMVFNIVYTLFFAVCLVCLARGMFHWAKTAWEKQLATAMDRPLTLSTPQPLPA